MPADWKNRGGEEISLYIYLNLSVSFSIYQISGSEQQFVTESCDTSFVEIPFDDFSKDAIKTELSKIEPFEDPLEVDEKGKIFFQ